MELTVRLKAIADMVTDGGCIVDVGTDHGYIPIYLMQNKKIAAAIAMDVNKGPLERAEKNIEKYGLTGKIRTQLSDGLAQLGDTKADAIIIAGMGGPLMLRILEEGCMHLRDETQLILQPQSEIGSVRLFLHKYGYKIIDENMIIDDGKYYTVMKAVKGSDQTYNRADYEFGQKLLERRHPVLEMYLKKELALRIRISGQLESAGTELAKERLIELADEIIVLKEALSVYEI